MKEISVVEDEVDELLYSDSSNEKYKKSGPQCSRHLGYY
jgi:hypothetical protein